MIKQIIKYFLVFSFLCVSLIALFTFVLNKTETILRFNIINVHLFNAVFCFVLCVVSYVVFKMNTSTTNIGFIYLSTLFLKMISFYVVFEKTIFDIPKLTTPEGLALLISLSIFLFFEVYFIAKILNSKEVKTITEKK